MLKIIKYTVFVLLFAACSVNAMPMDIGETQTKFTLTKAEVESANNTLRTLKWVYEKNGTYPENAFKAGYNGENPLYICSVNYLNGFHPGQLVASGCYISYKGQAFVKNEYLVLALNQSTNIAKDEIFWTQKNSAMFFMPNSVSMPNNTGSLMFPIVGGYEDEDQHHLYICRAMYANQLHVGKVVSNQCNIGVDGAEIEVLDFETLVG
jgi:hypothetical protein